MIPTLYTVQETMRATRESRRTILQDLHRGKFPGAYKKASGGKTSPWLIPEEDVARYIATK